MSASVPGGVSQILLGIALRDFPREPPTKYIGSNTIHLSLSFDNVYTVEWNGFFDIEPAEFDLTKDEAGVHFSYGNSSASLAFTAEFVGIAKITSYVFDPFAPKV